MASVIDTVVDSNLKYSFESPRRQYFSLPFNFVNYLMNACISPEVFEKLQKTCKHFFSKKKVIIVDVDACCGAEYFCYTYGNGDFDKSFSLDGDLRFWLKKQLIIHTHTFSPFINYIYRCDLHVLSDFKEDLTFKEICFLLNGGKIQFLLLEKVNIKHDDGTPVSIDLILKQCPKVQTLYYSNLCETFSSITFETLNQLEFKIIFSLEIVMSHVDGIIDPNTICLFLKNNVYSKASINIVFTYDYPQAEFDKLQLMMQNTLLNYKKLCLRRR